MLRGEDVVTLLRLSDASPGWTVRSLADEVHIPRSVVHRSIGRLERAGLFDAKRRRVNSAAADEFLVHAVKYVFPPVFGGESRGVPTGWAAAPLADRLAPSEGPPPVWPDAEGSVRGIALEPLHPAASAIAREDPKLGERLALVDALRIGDARTRGLAIELLRERLPTAGPLL